MQAMNNCVDMRPFSGALVQTQRFQKRNVPLFDEVALLTNKTTIWTVTYLHALCQH